MTNTRAQEATRVNAQFKEQEQQISELQETLACHDRGFDELWEDIRMMFQNFTAQHNTALGREPETTHRGTHHQ